MTNYNLLRARVRPAMILAGGLIFQAATGEEALRPGALLPGGHDEWKLVWSDEFDGTEEDLDTRWDSQNGPSGHILSSRWRENVSVGDGTLKLTNRKESRGGMEWTSGSIWSKERFTYGYFECRYKYAAATGTNNSFWLMTKGGEPDVGKRFEIDINEGHFPNEVNTNIHNWSDFTMVDGKKKHPSHSKSFPFGVKPDRTIQLEIPVTTRKVRFSSDHPSHFHIGEFQVFNVNAGGYPDVLVNGSIKPGLINFAADPTTKIEVSGHFNAGHPKPVSNLTDGKFDTSWVAQTEGEKWVEFTFDEDKTVGCIQFTNGWKSDHGWEGLLTDYKVQYHDGSDWVDMAAFDLSSGEVDFGRNFHTYGLKWDKDEIAFYFDGRELRSEKNEFCHSASPVWLSLAIIKWAGEVTDTIDGTKMEVDYVRVYKPKGEDAGAKVPVELESKYASVPNDAVSDEFNGSTLDAAKWAYRTKGEGWGTGPEYVAFEKDGDDRFVSIKGRMKTKLGAGIVTKEPTHFGFYSIRWRTDNISPDFMTPWHPAIWMAAQNFATGDDARAIKHAGKNVEIDFVEYWHQPVWHCQTIPWGWEGEPGEKKPVQKMLAEKNDFATTETGWQEHGLEYHPEYFQTWQKIDGEWKAIGERIPINNQPVSKSSLNKDHATPGYWIISNKEHFDNISKLYMFKDGLDRSKFRFEDCALQLDYFRYFPLKS